MEFGLDGTATLVTGGSSGLGRASATAIAREGADVAICARNAERLEAARSAINDVGDGAVLSVQADITDDQGDIAELVEETVAAFGRLDHLIVSTGGPSIGGFAAVDERDWYVAYDLLVMSVVRLTHEAYPYLATDGPGSIVVIGCTESREPVNEAVLSSAVRRATVGLVKTLSREFAPAVRANTVLAGPHTTPYLETVVREGVDRGRFPSSEDGLDALRSAVPLDRLGDPGEVGDVVAFLASERASYVTGAAIPVDGGLLRG